MQECTMMTASLGDDLTDNSYREDGYRFHDVMHLANVACLHWSPVLHALMKRKRKSNRRTDEVEDGARAMIFEELGRVNTTGLECGILRRVVLGRKDAGDQAVGTHGCAIRADRAASAETAWEREPVESPGAQRDSLCGRARLQVAGSAGAVRQLAHDLYADEPVVEERRPGSRLRAPAARADRPHQGGGNGLGQHQRQGASGQHGRAKKNGPQSIGKSRGGWTTKIHMVAADARTAVAFTLSPGQAHDAPVGRNLLTAMERPADRPALVMDRAL